MCIHDMKGARDNVQITVEREREGESGGKCWTEYEHVYSSETSVSCNKPSVTIPVEPWPNLINDFLVNLPPDSHVSQTFFQIVAQG